MCILQICSETSGCICVPACQYHGNGNFPGKEAFVCYTVDSLGGKIIFCANRMNVLEFDILYITACGSKEKCCTSALFSSLFH